VVNLCDIIIFKFFCGGTKVSKAEIGFTKLGARSRKGACSHGQNFVDLLQYQYLVLNMRIKCSFNLLLMGLVLVSGCLFHKKAKPPEPITFHEVLPTPALTNTVETAVATNGPGWDVAPSVAPVTNPAPPIAVSEPTNPVAPIDLSKAKLIVTPSTVTTATVTWVNSTAKFVVLTFPIGHLPAENQLMTLYRRGLKVGDVKVTGPKKDDNVVADLLDGDAELGDEVR